MATNNLSADDVCSICLCPLRNQVARQEIVQTPCQHIFHQTCLIGWITGGNPGGCCPLCKKEMGASDAIPVRIENLSTTGNSNGDIDIGKAVVIPLRRSQRLRGRQMSSNLQNRNETPTTRINTGMSQSDQQTISQTQGEHFQILAQEIQEQLERQSQVIQEHLERQSQEIQEYLERLSQELQEQLQRQSEELQQVLQRYA